MRSGIYMEQYGVRRSICLSQHGRPAGRTAGDIDRPLQQGCAAGECEQCHVVSVRRKLNTDLLLL